MTNLKKNIPKKIWYTSFDGSLSIATKGTNLKAATFKGKVPKKNVVIKIKERNYNSPGQRWKIEHLFISSLPPSGESTLLPTATSPPVGNPSLNPTHAYNSEPSSTPSSTPTAEPSVAPSKD